MKGNLWEEGKVLEEIIDDELGTMDTNDARKVIADAFTTYKHKLLHLLVQHQGQDILRSAFASGIQILEGEEFIPLSYDKEHSDIHFRLRDGALVVIHEGIPSTMCFDTLVTQNLCVPYVVRQGDEFLVLDKKGCAISIGGESTFDAVRAWNQYSLILEKNGTYLLFYYGDNEEQNTSPWLSTSPIHNEERGVMEASDLTGEPISLTSRFHVVPSDYTLQHAYESNTSCRVTSKQGVNALSLKTGQLLSKVWFTTMEASSYHKGIHVVGLSTLIDTNEGPRVREVHALWDTLKNIFVVPPLYDRIDYPNDDCPNIIEGQLGATIDVYTLSPEGNWEIVVLEAHTKKYFRYGKKNSPRKTGLIYCTSKEVVILREDGELWARVRGRVLEISEDYAHPVTLMTSRGSVLVLQGTSDNAEFEKVTVSKEQREFLQNTTFSCREEGTRLD
ncbi:hypothetical protein COW46_05205 [Candidatus Gracilibacteria bacterium CG17_big_fil_post_rev_8_21_14_2_50_48_13]|nr:MAG: hypothetical protein COW46_05205 [Candidatus Gracilibacteria bacterium CG17_big_fil_post_rev_8_21_14_2_50_48_13]